jgi:hypothetical protein
VSGTFGLPGISVHGPTPRSEEQIMDNQNKLNMKLSLKKETLKTLNDSEVALLDGVVGGTCIITVVIRTALEESAQ